MGFVGANGRGRSQPDLGGLTSGGADEHVSFGAHRIEREVLDFIVAPEPPAGTHEETSGTRQGERKRARLQGGRVGLGIAERPTWLLWSTRGDDHAARNAIRASILAMADSGVYFYASFSFPDAIARAAWAKSPLDPATEGSRLAPFRKIWTDAVRTDLFGSSVGLSHVQHDEAAARRALAPLIGDATVAQTERVDESDGTRSFTFHLAGELRRGASIDEACAFLDRNDLAFARVDEGSRTELLAWLDGYDGFERYVELLTLAALLADGHATAGHGFFVPAGIDADLADYGEWSWDEGPLQFETSDIQNFGGDAEQWLEDAMPKLEPLADGFVRP